MFERRVIIPVTQPFDFGLTLAFVRGFGPMAGEQRIEGEALTKSWIVDGQPITATMRQEGSGLACTLTSPRAIDDGAARAMCARVSSFTSATDDLSDFYDIAARDGAFAPVARRLRGLHHPKFATPFEAACWGVINQRIQLTQARTMKSALIARWGAASSDAFPEAATLAKATLTELTRTLGNERKAQAVWSVSQAFAKVHDSFLHAAPMPEVEAWLLAIHGVGPFTAAFVLYRGLGRPLALPWGPKFVTAAKHTYGPTTTRASLETRSHTYGRWLGLWSLYLWAATFIHQRKDGPPIRQAATLFSWRLGVLAASPCKAR